MMRNFRIRRIQRDAQTVFADIVLDIVVTDESRVFGEQLLAVNPRRPVVLDRPASELISVLRHFRNNGIIENIDGIRSDIFPFVLQNDLDVSFKPLQCGTARKSRQAHHKSDENCHEASFHTFYLPLYPVLYHQEPKTTSYATPCNNCATSSLKLPVYVVVLGSQPNIVATCTHAAR